MGIFTDQKPTQAKKEPTPIELVAAAMGEELHFTVTTEQAIERLCRIYLNEIKN